MTQLVSNISNIGSYDAYVIELSDRSGYENEITRALDRNFGQIGRNLGENQVYVREYETEVSDFLFERLDKDPFGLDLPALLILDKHPAQLDENDECILIELGDFNSEREVTRIMSLIQGHLKNEDFMTSLTWNQRKQRIKNALQTIVAPGQIAISVLSLL